MFEAAHIGHIAKLGGFWEGKNQEGTGRMRVARLLHPREKKRIERKAYVNKD